MGRALRYLAIMAVVLLAASAQAEPARAFAGTDIGSDTLVFHRPAADGSGTEGFVIDVPALVETLKTRVLKDRGLGEVVSVTRQPPLGSLRESAPPEEMAATPYVFSHRFAAPFDSVDATLRLTPLEEPDQGALVNWLVVLLALAVVGGLFALYQMTATQVAFAQRRSNFVSAVSHELKTPLTAIRMYGEMLQEGLLDDDAKRQEYYRTITAESERLSRLINNVLELSRIERRDSAQQLRTADIRGVVREVVEVLRPHADREGFSLELDLAERLPEVRHEPDTLRQILFNLIDNALKYCRDAADKRVSISCQAAPSGVTLAVRDRGPGVQPDQLRSIFDPFFRGERELTRRYTGTGIGLALVKGLAERMGGSVQAFNASPGLAVEVRLMGEAAERKRH